MVSQCRYDREHYPISDRHVTLKGCHSDNTLAKLQEKNYKVNPKALL